MHSFTLINKAAHDILVITSVIIASPNIRILMVSLEFTCIPIYSNIHSSDASVMREIVIQFKLIEFTQLSKRNS